MGLTEEQRARMDELRSANKKLISERNTAQEKERMAEWIENFAEKYTFADETVAEKLYSIIDEIPYGFTTRPDFNCLPDHRKVSETELRGGRVWICFLCGTEEIFHIFVSGTLSDFLEDYDDWYFISPYLLLIYDDFNRFLYIDDNGDMTEALNCKKDRTKED